MLGQKYFKAINKTLKAYERALPFLLIDLDRMDHNIQQVKQEINEDLALRLVVKSLPSFPLLRYLMKGLSTNRLMVFHQPFLSQIFKEFQGESLDVLLGKPMPVKTLKYFFEHLVNDEQKVQAAAQLQCLVDSEDRLREYLALAKELQVQLRINLEIDVGLHRGGLETEEELANCLEIIINNKKHLQFSGLMGYDPHVVKLPKWLRSKEKALKLSQDKYRDFLQVLEEQIEKTKWKDLCLNGAGSPTFNLHQRDNSVLNEVSIGSCLVKPSTFDLPNLGAFQAAAFIATPILKKRKNTQLPALEKWTSLLNVLDKANKNSYFIYGGFWKADYVFPKGTKENKLFGSSTNQSMVNIPDGDNLAINDFVFLRPQQSEFVFLQFGKLLAIRNQQVVEEWAPISPY